MKKTFLILVLMISFLLCACSGGQPNTAEAASPAAMPTPTPTETLPNTGFGSAGPSAPGETAAPTASVRQGSLYDPSIFVIEASDSWQEELDAGYYANYECELYLHKIDSNNNRRVEGAYEGCFWMKTGLDTSEFLKDLLKDVPVEMSFDAGGEAVADNLGIYLNTTDDKAWVDYSIMGEDGQPLPLTQDTPVARGSFVTVAKSVYLEAHARGAQDEKLDYSDASEGDIIDVNYVIHVQPGTSQSGSQREATINLSGNGFNRTMKGVLKILSGYPEDLDTYYNSEGYKNSAWRNVKGNDSE